MRVGFTAFLITLIADQLSKYWVVEWLELKTLRVIEVFPPYLTFHMAWNRGVNFGLFSGDSDASRWILIAVAFVVIGLVLFWVRKETNKKALLSAGVLIGGAIGNVVDRIQYGAVADFLNMSCCGLDNPFSFNVADIAIFAGAIGLVIWGSDEKVT